MELNSKKILLYALMSCLIVFIQSYKHFNRNNGTPGYLLLAPSSFLMGANNKVCISRFGSASIGIATAHIELLSIHSNSNDKTVRHVHKFITRARKTFPDGNGGCIEIPIPKTSYRRAILHLRMRFDSLPNYKVNARKEVKIQHDSNINIIQTDKPIYRGGETVKFRILQLKTDLTPQYAPIFRVYLEAPSDIFGGPIKIAQWFNVSTQMGYIQREYKLDKYARKGDWRIVVDSRDSTVASTTQNFHVVDYNLPKFYLKVDYQKKIVSTLNELKWTICVRYMYEEATRGTLFINVKTDAFEPPNIYFSTTMNNPSGCYDYTLSTKSLNFNKNDEHKPKFVIADISFQEIDTNIWKNTTAVTSIKDNVINVKFIDDDRNYYKPGLPHKVNIKVYDWKEEGVSRAKVQFCRYIDQEIDNINDGIQPMQTNDCDTSITDNKGYASFAFTIPSNIKADFVYLNCIVQDHPFRNLETASTKQTIISDSLKLYSWGNKTNVNMEIGSPISEPSYSEYRESKYIFPIFVKFDREDIMRQITLHYLIITRSGTITSWGISKQCIHPIHDVQNIEIIFGPSIATNECEQEKFSETGVYKMMLNLKVSYLMCPHSHLIVYFVRPNGDLIVANKLFETSDCLPNKLTQRWIPNVASPSSEVKLNLNSMGPALCMMGVKNVALNYIAQNYSVYNDVLNKIQVFINSRYNRTQAEFMSNICFSNNIPKAADELNRLSYWNTIKLFLSSGLEILTDLLPVTTKCPKSDIKYNVKPAEFSLPFYFPPSKERVYFPETWLWDVRLMDTSGELNISAIVPHDITNWESEAFCITRLGIAATIPNQNAILKVFQPFFIEISAPSVIKRGERIQMYYKIYNYMEQIIPVSFDINITPTAAASIISHERSINRIVCIPKKQSILTHFTVKAHQLRSINITVSAQIKSNMQQICSIDSSLFLRDIRDVVIKEILVEPEGVPVENHRSALLCTHESTNKSEISWEFNRENCVDQSENWIISLVGDITGPMTLNVEKLISTPMGCGEQNMALLAYNLIALQYSVAKKRISSEIKEAAIKNLLIGYQKQLNYYHSDTGAFSAFGRSDESGSTWLTAFCVKYLSILQKRWNIGVESEVVDKASNWLLNRQMENGCFSNEGQVFHREMKGGLQYETSNVALTAYVVISILDADIPNLKYSLIQNTAYCLSALQYDVLLSNFSDSINQQKSNTMYTYALALLAQLKIEKYINSLKNSNKLNSLESNMEVDAENTNEQFDIKMLAGNSANAVALLKMIARRNGEFIWWEAGSLPVSIETTAYAILSLLTIGGEDNIMTAIGAAKWLSTHRSSNGGMLSTQDTLITIEALCFLRYSMPDLPPAVNVIVEGPGRSRHFTVSPSERHKLHIVTMKSINSSSTRKTKLNVKAYGKGCLLVQQLKNIIHILEAHRKNQVSDSM